MAAKKETNLPVAHVGQVLKALPTPQLKLATIEDCRREMARVYRDARSNLIETQDASRLVYILYTIAKMIEIDQPVAPKSKADERICIPNDPVEAARVYQRMMCGT